MTYAEPAPSVRPPGARWGMAPPPRTPGAARHSRVITAMADLVATGRCTCRRCRRPIHPGDAWHTPAIDGDPTRYGMPRHRGCR